MRKQFSGEFKSKVALAAIKENQTLAELSNQFEVHAIQISRWKSQAIERLGELFSEKKVKGRSDQTDAIAELYEKIGRLEVENDWLKKKLHL